MEAEMEVEIQAGMQEEIETEIVTETVVIEIAEVSILAGIVHQVGGAKVRQAGSVETGCRKEILVYLRLILSDGAALEKQLIPKKNTGKINEIGNLVKNGNCGITKGKIKMTRLNGKMLRSKQRNSTSFSKSTMIC